MDLSRDSYVNYAILSRSHSRSAQVNYFSSWEENSRPYDGTGSSYSKAKFMCSFGGRILPRPSDMKLRYVGGETKMISVPRNIGYEAFRRKMEGIYGSHIILRYQLPEEDLDALVSVSSDEDLENMMEECDRLDCTGSLAKLRVFVFLESEVDNIGLDDVLDPKTSEQIFVDAINIMSFDQSSRENANLQFTELDSSKVVNVCSPWDAFLAECQQTKATPLEEHLSSENLHPKNQTLSTEVSHLVSSHGSLDDLLGEHPYSDKLPAAVFHEKHMFPSTNDAQEFYDIESGLLETSLASSQWKTQSNSYEESKQLAMEEARNGLIHHEEKGQGNDLNCSTCLHVQVDLSDSEINSHHWNVFQELDVDNWNNNLSSGIDQLKLFQEDSHGPEKITSVNFAELNDKQNISLESGHQRKYFFHQAAIEDLLQETKLTYPEATAISASVLYQGKNLPSIFDSNYLHEQGVLISDEIRYNLPSKIEKMEIKLAPTCEHDSTSMSFVNIMDYDGVPYSTISSVQINQNAQQGDNGNCMHPIQPTVLNKDFGSLPSPKKLLEDELLFGDITRSFFSKDFEASKTSTKSQTDVETFPLRSKSSGLSSAEGSIDLRENTHACEQLEHDSEVLIPCVCNESLKLTAVSEILCSPQPKNYKLHNSTSEEMIVSDVYVDQGQNSCIAKEVVESGTMKNEFYNLPSFVETESEDLILPSIENSLSSKEHFDKSAFTGESVLGEKKSLKNVEDLSALVSNSTNDSALVSLIKTWERSLLQDDEQIQHPAVLDVLHEEVPELEDKTATVEVSDAEFEEHNEFQSFDYGPVNIATVAEEEARVRGLQTIRNCDLEDLRELGSGTFGTVYHGKWRGTDVAIKRIKASLFAGQQNERERLMADFWHEACLLSKLHHPNVVAFYGVVPDGPDGTLATVSEYMANGSIKQVLQRKDRILDRRKRLLIAMDAAFGMEYLHGKNVVHFDIKCENLLVNMRDIQRPICKVGDLGLSKVKQKTFVSGGVRGTLPWMAPELLNGSTNLVSEKVDVFSFGIVMWELLTGEEPYANMHYGAIIGGIVNNTLRPRIPRSCDPAWRSLMEKCWAADPAERPTFSEIAKSLRGMES